MKIDAKTREEYFDKVGDRADDLRLLDEIIGRHAPDLKPENDLSKTSYMLGYGMQPYKPKSSKVETEWPLVALASQKNHMSLYVCAVTDGEYMAERYSDRLGKVSCGKSCIRFKKVDDLNLDTVGEMLRELNERVKRGEKVYGA